MEQEKRKEPNRNTLGFAQIIIIKMRTSRAPLSDEERVQEHLGIEVILVLCWNCVDVESSSHDDAVPSPSTSFESDAIELKLLNRSNKHRHP